MNPVISSKIYFHLHNYTNHHVTFVTVAMQTKEQTHNPTFIAKTRAIALLHLQGPYFIDDGLIFSSQSGNINVLQ